MTPVPDETLLSFKPDIVFIHTTNRNVTDWPEMTDTTEQIDEKLHTEINRFTAMWKSIAEKFHCPIIQNNFEMPFTACSAAAMRGTSTAARISSRA